MVLKANARKRDFADTDINLNSDHVSLGGQKWNRGTNSEQNKKLAPYFPISR